MYTISYTYIVYDIVFDIDDIVHDIVYDGLPEVWYLNLSRADVLRRVPLIPCYLNDNSVKTIPRNFRVRSQRKLQQILDPTVGLGAGCSKSTCGCGAMEGPFLVKSLWSKLWNCAKRGCRIQQESRTVVLRLFSARVIEPGQRELPLRSEWHWLNAISYTISNPICYDMTFNIERQIDLRYRIRYQHKISNCVCSISKAWNFDIRYPVNDLRYRSLVIFDIEQSDLWYRTPSISTYDIEGTKRRYRMSIRLFRYRSLRYRLWRSILNVRYSISGLQESRWRMPAHLHRLDGAQTEWKAARWSVPAILHALFFLLYALFFLAE